NGCIHLIAARRNRPVVKKLTQASVRSPFVRARGRQCRRALPSLPREACRLHIRERRRSQPLARSPGCAVGLAPAASSHSIRRDGTMTQSTQETYGRAHRIGSWAAAQALVAIAAVTSGCSAQGTETLADMASAPPDLTNIYPPGPYGTDEGSVVRDFV